MDILVVIDMQNDFVSGVLGSTSAQTIVPLVLERIDTFDGKIIFTKDTHKENYLDTMEGKKLPVKHCIKGTYGHDIVDGLNTKNHEVIEKTSFGSPDLIYRLQEINKQEPITSITLIGVCTDICVMVNAMTIKSFFPEIEIIVDSIYCSGVTEELHKNALDIMTGCQIKVI